MAIDTYFERISRIDRLIRLKATGTPADLAQILEISESGLYRYIGYMRLMGAPIIFCKSRISYVYEDNGKFQMGFVATPINDNELSRTFGGLIFPKKINYFSCSQNMRVGGLTFIPNNDQKIYHEEYLVK